jgi:hypothetical protein
MVIRESSMCDVTVEKGLDSVYRTFDVSTRKYYGEAVRENRVLLFVKCG